MCFSATASFTAGTALSAAGALTLSKTKTRRELPFAAIPLLLGIQQVLEGFVWLALSSVTSVNTLAAYVYSFIAHVWWPFFVPLAVFVIERDAKRKRLIGACAVIGFFTAAWLLYGISITPTNAHVVGGSIHYYSPQLVRSLVTFLYVLALCGSCLLSSHRMVALFGAAILISFAISMWFFLQVFVSVWCFFAAILSGIVYLHVVRKKR